MYDAKAELKFIFKNYASCSCCCYSLDFACKTAERKQALFRGLIEREAKFSFIPYPLSLDHILVTSIRFNDSTKSDISSSMGWGSGSGMTKVNEFVGAHL